MVFMLASSGGEHFPIHCNADSSVTETFVLGKSGLLFGEGLVGHVIKVFVGHVRSVLGEAF